MKSVLLSTLISDGYEHCLEDFFDYFSAEVEDYPQLKLLIVSNNCSLELLNNLKGICEANRDVASYIYTGEFKDKNDAIVNNRNVAIERARDCEVDYLYFLDIDTIPKHLSVRVMVSYLNGMKRAGAVFGKYYRKSDTMHTPFGEGVIIVGSFNPLEFQGKNLVNKKYIHAILPPFGYTMVRNDIFKKYDVDRDFGVFKSEDYPYFERAKSDGWKYVCILSLEAKHITQKKDGLAYAVQRSE